MLTDLPAMVELTEGRETTMIGVGSVGLVDVVKDEEIK